MEFLLHSAERADQEFGVPTGKSVMSNVSGSSDQREGEADMKRTEIIRAMRTIITLEVVAMMSCFAEEHVTAYRKGNEYWVKSSFSAEKDIVIHRFLCGGNNNPNEAAYLVRRGTPITDYGQGERIHRNGDELPAFPTLSHGTLGGNHASVFAREMLAPGHGLDESAIGRRLTDEAGLGVMFGWGGGSIAQKQTEEFYIPKLKPIRTTPYGPEQVSYDCDFSAIYRMPNPMSVNYNISPSDCLNPEDPPDRFIRVVGNDRRELGIAIGYSLFEGCTAKERKGADRPVVYRLYRTKKMYPYCYRWANARQGESRRVLAYRQYFDPQREPQATAFYYHKQMSSDVVYLDVHQSLDHKTISLPQCYAGKKVTVLEETPSVELHFGEAIPASGAITLSVRDGDGYVVLKLD